MPTVRIFARQGHATPSGPYRPHGPFPPEIFAQNPRAEDVIQHSDSLHESLDDVRLFRCRDCGGFLYEDEKDNHDCESEY
jgi:hypothetical protein